MNDRLRYELARIIGDWASQIQRTEVSAFLIEALGVRSSPDWERMAGSRAYYITEAEFGHALDPRAA